MSAARPTGGRSPSAGRSPSEIGAASSPAATGRRHGPTSTTAHHGEKTATHPWTMACCSAAAITPSFIEPDGPSRSRTADPPPEDPTAPSTPSNAGSPSTPLRELAAAGCRPSSPRTAMQILCNASCCCHRGLRARCQRGWVELPWFVRGCWLIGAVAPSTAPTTSGDRCRSGQASPTRRPIASGVGRLGRRAGGVEPSAGGAAGAGRRAGGGDAGGAAGRPGAGPVERRRRVTAASREAGLFHLGQAGGRDELVEPVLALVVARDTLASRGVGHLDGLFGPGPGVLAQVGEPLRSAYLAPMLAGDRRAGFAFTEPADAARPTWGRVDGDDPRRQRAQVVRHRRRRRRLPHRAGRRRGTRPGDGRHRHRRARRDA